MKTNYLLIDLENVRPQNLGLLSGSTFKIKIFRGQNQKQYPVDMVEALQPFGADAEYIPITGQGKNALDFHIAYYIGRISVEDPNAFFHIISGDTGFDPLIAHLKTKKILCQRSPSIESIPFVKGMNAKTPTERAAALTEFLSQPKVTRPRTVKTLGNMIKAKFANQISDEDVAKVIDALTKAGAISVQQTKVTYHLET